VITDDDYLVWLTKKYPQLLQHQAILEKAREVFLKLKNVDETAESLSQLVSKELLWPTSAQLTESQSIRFFGQSAATFTFLGRSFVRQVADSTRRRIFLYGPQGVGKSHILAAVALVLSVKFAKGEAGSLPVCYIPDMGDALNEGIFFSCFLQAFINQPTELAAVGLIDPSDVPSLGRWTRNHGGITFIADQCNAIGKSLEPGKQQTREDEALEKLIKGAGFGNRLIFAASSNQTKVDVFSTSMDQDPALKILIPPFTRDEYCSFLEGSFPQFVTQLTSNASLFDPTPPALPAAFAALVVPAAPAAPAGGNVVAARPLITWVEETTGFVPLEVYTFCQKLEQIRKRKREQGHDENLSLREVSDSLNEFSTSITTRILEFLKGSFYGVVGQFLANKISAMSLAASGVCGFRNTAPMPRDVDWRFYYPVGEAMVAVPVSVLANRTVIAALTEKAQDFTRDERKKLLKEISGSFNLRNPSVTGFIVEGIIIACLKTCGWGSFNKFDFPSWPSNVKAAVNFDGDGHLLPGSDFDATLLIPNKWNFPLVDAVMVYQTKTKGNGNVDVIHCYVVGIQITIAKPTEHAHSYEFVTDAARHLQFVPESYWLPRLRADPPHPPKFSVGLLWIVHERDLGNLPAGDHQGAVGLEWFTGESGVPIPK